jgi:predicted dienelactone hydrolase
VHTYDDIYEGTARESVAADCGETRPVMVFSHGSGGIRWQSLYLVERLATRGWIVVAPDHVGNTFLDDGEIDTVEVMSRRPGDIRATYDWLLATAGDRQLTGCIDAAAGFTMAGHSFGAYTTLVVAGATLDVAASQAWCATNGGWLCDEVNDFTIANPDVTVADWTDDRVTAAVTMAPAGYEVLVGGLSNVTVPHLSWGGSLDELTPVEEQVRPLWEGVGSSPKYLAVLEGAGHFTFSDACNFLPIFEDCKEPYLQGAEAHPVIGAVTTAFVEGLLGADTEGWLPPEDSRVAWEQR